MLAISASSEGRAERFVEMFNDYVPLVRGFVRTKIAPADVESVVQATFETAWTKFESVPLLSQKAWLFGVARNHVRNHARAARRRHALLEAVAAMSPVEAVVGLESDIDEIDLRELYLAISRLSETDQEIVELTVWHDLKAHEIAEVMSLSSSNVRVRLHRARRRLAMMLAADSIEAGE